MDAGRTKAAPRLLIAGTGSGCGKTTVVCAVLRALKNRGLSPVAFKCGPDYIDPMFHTAVLGVESVNLDVFFTGEDGVRGTFGRYAGDMNVIEGVMGLYDGLAMDSHRASGYHVAELLDAPVLLVVDARGMALSAAAEVKGFMSLRQPNRVRGVLFNRISPAAYPALKRTVERECGVPVYGFLPRGGDWALESRHLGLVTAGEIGDIQEKMDRLAAAAEESVDLNGLIALMRDQSPVSYTGQPIEPLGRVRVAVARDRAFCFYYRENLELLRALGAELVPFSLLEDAAVPACDGLYLGGGYPELYLKQLSGNQAMLSSVRRAVEDGLPTVAECGGFMYLCRSIDGVPMAGVIETDCQNAHGLRRFGYASLIAEEESLLFAPGDTIRGHEFHYWDAGEPGGALRAVKPNGRESRCAWVSETLYAGFPHLYFPGSAAGERFIRKCLERRRAHEAHGDREKEL